MNDNIFTREEYTKKMNNLAKPMVEFATSTKEFNGKGCYSEEFVKVGDREVTLAVVDDRWVLVTKDSFNDLIEFKRRYYKMQKEFDEFLENVRKHYRKKFLGIF